MGSGRDGIADVEIRRVGAADADLFQGVAEGVFDEPIAPARLAAYLAEPGHHMVVAVHDGVVVGQVAAVVHRHPDKVTELYVDEVTELYVDEVGVAPRMQRRGFARRMLDEMFALGRELGCEEAWLGTEPDNGPARGLYESRGSTAGPFVMYVFPL